MDASAVSEWSEWVRRVRSQRLEDRRFATAEALMAKKDGVLQLEQHERHLVHESFTVDTRDHEDHTFCGIMFDLECSTVLPAEYMEVEAVSVRGHLGPMTVWTTPGGFAGRPLSARGQPSYRAWPDYGDAGSEKFETPEAWTRVYAGEHDASPDEYTALRLSEPIRLRPGESCGVYVHSALRGDRGLVYDDQRNDVTHADKVCRVRPGMAHLSCHPFGKRGMWGFAWRHRREFVGQLEYGVKWRRWSPSQHVHLSFPLGFRRAVRTLLMGSRRPESLLYLLQDEVLHFILNRLRWDSFGEAMAEEEEEEEEEEEAPRLAGAWWHEQLSPRESARSIASNVTARRLARAQSRFRDSLSLGQAVAASAQAAHANGGAADDEDDASADANEEGENESQADGQSAIGDAAGTSALPTVYGASQGASSLLDARIRELIATVGDGRLAHSDESSEASDHSDSDEVRGELGEGEEGEEDELGSDGEEVVGPEPGSDAWVAEQVRLTAQLDAANYDLETTAR